MVLGVAMFVMAAVPQFALASWWNPFTWFSKNEPTVVSPHISIQQQVGDNKSGTIDLVASSTATSTTINTTENISTPTPTKKTPHPVQIKSMITPQVSVQAPVVTAPPTNTTLCNGVTYSSCPVNSDLVCPSNAGKAYCQPSQTSTTAGVQQSSPNTQDNTNKEVILKSRSLELINTIITDENQLNSDTTQEISILNSNLNTIGSTNDSLTQAFRSLTTLRRDRLMSSQTALRQAMLNDQAQKTKFETNSLDTFLNFDPDSYFKNELNTLINIRAQFDADRSSYQNTMRNYVNSVVSTPVQQYVQQAATPTYDPAVCQSIRNEPIAVSVMAGELAANNCPY